MPVYLGKYTGAAKDRENKLIRAINSVINQTYKDWELLIICDGCKKSFELCKPFVNDKIRLFEIPKQPLWSGNVRNVGITKSKGNWITYLDSDDYFGKNHLDILYNQLTNKDWYFFNDIIWNKKKTEWEERKCFLELSYCGTANIIHKKIAYWNAEDNYGHDWHFIRKLMAYKYEKIKTPQYYVAHIPGLKGYDI